MDKFDLASCQVAVVNAPVNRRLVASLNSRVSLAYWLPIEGPGHFIGART